MERKSSEKYSVVFLVEGKKFKDFIFVVGSAVNLLAQRLSSKYFAEVPTPNKAELCCLDD